MYRKLTVIILALCALNSCVRQTPIQVAVHRGDWRNYADNSLEGIESCIRMGADIVEIDIAMTKDGHLILMHDRTVDRTTNGKGRVGDLTLAEIRELRLRNGLGRVTDFKIPTLEEAMQTAKGRITVNLDKADEYFDRIYEVLEKTGTTEQTIIKSNKPFAHLKERYGAILDKMIFMPVVILKKETAFDSIVAVLNEKHSRYEFCFREENRELWLRIREKLRENKSVIWINSLWDSLCAGHSDDKALTDPDGAWGYLIRESGAGILQTDRPAQMLDYLKKQGRH